MTAPRAIYCRPAGSPGPRAVWTAVALWMGVIVVLSVLPLGSGGWIRLPLGTDKWMHAFFYGALAALAAEAWAAVGAGPRLAAARGLAQAVAYGAAVEWFQSFTARQPSLADWVADLAGAAIGSAAWIAARGQARREEER